MSEPFLGDIRIVGFNFPPLGWAQCDGQILPIAQNTALFSLLGTTFGGDGETSFALPDMRGRAPLHQGTAPGLSTRSWGQRAGQDEVTLTTAQIPAHTHSMKASSDSATSTMPGGNLPASVHPGFNVYSDTANAEGEATQVTSGGGGQGHNNMQPCLALNFVIALQGVFPPRN